MSIIIDSLDLSIQLDPNYISPLDQSILSNNIIPTTLVCSDTLCNNYLTRKYNTPHKCLPNICHKSPLFFAIYINFSILKHLIFHLLTYHKTYPITDIITTINNISDCGCQYPYTYNTKYNIPSYTKIFTTDFIINIKKLINYPDDSNLSLINDLFNNTCLKTPLDCTIDINTIKRNIIILANNYIISLDNLYLLYKQQAFDLYKYYLSIKWPDMLNIINDLFVDVSNNNLYKITVESGDYPTYLSALNKYNKVTNIDELLNIAITNKYYMSVGVLLDLANDYDVSNIFNKLLLVSSNSDLSDKLHISGIIGKLFNKNLVINKDQLITIIKHPLSDILLPLVDLSKYSLLLGDDLIYLSVALDKPFVLDILLKYITPRDNSAYFYGMHNTKVIDILCKNKLPVDQRDYNNFTPLIYAVMHNKLNAVKLLIDASANVNEYLNGQTAMHIAISEGRLKIINALAKTSSLNKPNSNGVSPLMSAVSSIRPLHCMEVLINNKCDVNYLDNNKKSIMDYVLESMYDDNVKIDMFKLLLRLDLPLTDNNYQCKPIVIKAVEGDYLYIVIMIMNKLLSNGDISVGNDTLLEVASGFPETDIIDIVNNDTLATVAIKDNSKPNFYQLVLLYLKNNLNNIIKDKYNTNIINSLHSVPKIKRSNVILDPIRDRQNMITLYISCCLILAIGIVDIELDK